MNQPTSGKPNRQAQSETRTIHIDNIYTDSTTIAPSLQSAKSTNNYLHPSHERTIQSKLDSTPHLSLGSRECDFGALQIHFEIAQDARFSVRFERRVDKLVADAADGVRCEPGLLPHVRMVANALQVDLMKSECEQRQRVSERKNRDKN
jgi:hypothetical protein